MYKFNASIVTMRTNNTKDGNPRCAFEILLNEGNENVALISGTYSYLDIRDVLQKVLALRGVDRQECNVFYFPSKDITVSEFNHIKKRTLLHYN